jgi:hypothetical protein
MERQSGACFCYKVFLEVDIEKAIVGIIPMFLLIVACAGGAKPDVYAVEGKRSGRL